MVITSQRATTTMANNNVGFDFMGIGEEKGRTTGCRIFPSEALHHASGKRARGKLPRDGFQGGPEPEPPNSRRFAFHPSSFALRSSSDVATDERAFDQ
jgi:hypothetical protein